MKTLYISKEAKRKLNLAELKEKFKVNRVRTDPKYPKLLKIGDWYMITEAG